MYFYHLVLHRFMFGQQHLAGDLRLACLVRICGHPHPVSQISLLLGQQGWMTGKAWTAVALSQGPDRHPDEATYPTPWLARVSQLL